jgi:hypothetical protein
MMSSAGAQSLDSTSSTGALRPVATGSGSARSRSSRSGSRSPSEDSADISPSDQHLLEAKERVQHDSKKVLTEVPKSLLGSFSVACFIANRMIGMTDSHGLARTNKLIIHDVGTGIFDGPTSILQQDHNVGWSLILWALGCIASIAGVLMYVEYGLTIPRHKLDDAEPGDEEVFVARRQVINCTAGLSTMLTGLVAGSLTT